MFGADKGTADKLDGKKLHIGIVQARFNEDITNALAADQVKLNEVLRMILETMFRALGFRRIVFCLRDPKTETLTGRFGLGEGAEAVAAAPDSFTGRYLAPLLAGHVAPGGHLVLAGILDRQADELKAAYAPWLALEVSDTEDGWILMTARRSA